MKKVNFLVVLVFLLGLGFYLFYREGSLPVNKNDKTTKIFVINKGQSLTGVVNDLSKEGLIRNRLIFFLIVKKLGIERKIQAGDFRLSPSFTAYQIAENLTHGTLDVWVTLIEGTRKEEMAQVIGKELDIPEVEFIEEAREGYMFPDTYLFPKDATAESIVQILESNFNKKFTAKLQEKAKEKGLSPTETIILASLVEREARLADDRPLVASVILNRLKAGMKLDVDATVQYALGYQSEEKSWWKKALSLDDLKIDFPYNTYRNKGLPPGPIGNPGLAAIEAVVDAPETDYLYYLSDKTGKMHYSATFEEHQRNISKYLQ